MLIHNSVKMFTFFQGWIKLEELKISLLVFFYFSWYNFQTPRSVLFAIKPTDQNILSDMSKHFGQKKHASGPTDKLRNMKFPPFLDVYYHLYFYICRMVTVYHYHLYLINNQKSNIHKFQAVFQSHENLWKTTKKAVRA